MEISSATSGPARTTICEPVIHTDDPPLEQSPPLISLVVPVYNEAANIQSFLRDVTAQVHEPHEILIVHDFPEDNTLPAIAAMLPPCPAVRLVHNTLGRGVLNAIKSGFQASRGDVVIVMMADCSDEPRDVVAMARLVREGADVVAGSRYAAGGR